MSAPASTAVPPEFSASPESRSGPAPAISVRRLVKKFGEVTALDQVTLEVPPGQVLGLLGPNGAGKTTLIRILLGLTRSTSGEAYLLGEPAGARGVRTRVGYMPQDLAVYLDLSVEENVTLFGRLYGISGSRLRSRSQEVLERVHLADRSRSIVAELSGGMRRRVSLAAALVADPDLLLLDEPTVGVDPELRAEFWEFFHRLTRAGKTVVLTTHYLEEANRADRVVFLHAGRVLATGTPSDLKATTGTENLEDAFLRIVRARGGT
ncbi:MAG TPA: ABC transporter ATP-binding protein [Thermoplasmata archaeon]|nr:ABC transporter ATP-binding protein [Thermoplasmata archaeon]